MATDVQVERVARTICCPTGECRNATRNRGSGYISAFPCDWLTHKEEAHGALLAARPTPAEHAAGIAAAFQAWDVAFWAPGAKDIVGRSQSKMAVEDAVRAYLRTAMGMEVQGE